MRTWKYPSSRGVGEYTVTLADNGLLGCDCRGWVFKRGSQPRHCKHTKDRAEQEGWTPEVRGDYVFVDPPALTPLASNDILIVPVTEAMTTTATLLEGMKASAIAAERFPKLLDADGYLIPAAFDAAFSNDQWVLDEKLDGWRCLIVKQGTVVNTPTSLPRGLPAHIVSAMQMLPDGIYDGELLVPGGQSTDVPSLAFRNELIYAVFDVLELLGQSTISKSQTERRQFLELAMAHAPNQSAVVLVAQHTPSWSVVQEIWGRGGEGAILKRRASKYKPGDRSGDWLKVKKLEHHTVTVTGFEAGSLGPTAVVLFKFDDGTEGRTKNIRALEETAVNPDAFIGRRLVVECQQRNRGSKSPRHPRMDHWAGDAE